MITNKECAERWKRNKPGESGHISTDGNNLFSYGLLIGKTINGTKIVFEYTAVKDNFISRTTSNHIRHAKLYADCVRNPNEKD